ncbi:MAG: hypothetical protein NT145_08775, partial [Elusimicrobia bacterium]|nr:hypothetical protein [Elusimicrobiota bacterium]
MIKKVAFVLVLAVIFNNFCSFGIFGDNLHTEFEQALEAQGTVIGLMTAVNLPIKILNKIMGESSPLAQKKQDSSNKNKEKNPTSDLAAGSLEKTSRFVKKVEKQKKFGFEKLFSYQKNILAPISEFINKSEISEYGGFVFLFILGYLVLLRRSGLPSAFILIIFSFLSITRLFLSRVFYFSKKYSIRLKFFIQNFSLPAAIKLLRWFKNQAFNKIVAIIVVSCFLFTSVFAQTLKAALAEEKPENSFSKVFSSFNIPTTVGKITHGKYFGSDKVIVNIQDLHCNAEVQKNISKIIGLLDEKYNLHKVFLEGASGEINTSWINSVKDNELKKQLVETLINQGRLTGAEYYSINKGKFALLQGIEEKEIHKSNIIRLGKIIERQKYYKDVLNSLKEDLKFIQAKYFNYKNKKFNEIIIKQKEGKISSEKYFKILKKYADKINEDPKKYNSTFTVDINNYSNITGYLELLDKGQKLDYKRISGQLQQFINEIKKTIPYQDYKLLVEKTENFSKLDLLYTYLAEISERAKNISYGYPDLKKFFDYLEKGRALNPLQLVKEEKKLIEEIRIGLSEDIAELEVSFLNDFFTYFEDYLTNKLQSEDYEYFKERFTKFKLVWGKYTYKDKLQDLETDFKLLDEYYNVNEERNKSFVANILNGREKKVECEARNKILEGSLLSTVSCLPSAAVDEVVNSLSDAKEIIVIITGGFHTEGLEKLFSERNISYLTITPNITGCTKESVLIYEEIAKHQARRQLSATADRSVTSPRPIGQGLRTEGNQSPTHRSGSMDRGQPVTVEDRAEELRTKKLSLPAGRRGAIPAPATGGRCYPLSDALALLPASADAKIIESNSDYVVVEIANEKFKIIKNKQGFTREGISETKEAKESENIFSDYLNILNDSVKVFQDILQNLPITPENLLKLIVKFYVSQGLKSGNGIIWEIVKDKGVQSKISSFLNITEDQLGYLPDYLQRAAFSIFKFEENISDNLFEEEVAQFRVGARHIISARGVEFSSGDAEKNQLIRDDLFSKLVRQFEKTEITRNSQDPQKYIDSKLAGMRQIIDNFFANNANTFFEEAVKKALNTDNNAEALYLQIKAIIEKPFYASVENLDKDLVFSSFVRDLPPMVELQVIDRKDGNKIKTILIPYTDSYLSGEPITMIMTSYKAHKILSQNKIKRVAKLDEDRTDPEGKWILMEKIQGTLESDLDKPWELTREYFDEVYDRYSDIIDLGFYPTNSERIVEKGMPKLYIFYAFVPVAFDQRENAKGEIKIMKDQSIKVYFNRYFEQFDKDWKPTYQEINKMAESFNNGAKNQTIEDVARQETENADAASINSYEIARKLFGFPPNWWKLSEYKLFKSFVQIFKAPRWEEPVFFSITKALFFGDIATMEEAIEKLLDKLIHENRNNEELKKGIRQIIQAGFKVFQNIFDYFPDKIAMEWAEEMVKKAQIETHRKWNIEHQNRPEEILTGTEKGEKPSKNANAEKEPAKSVSNKTETIITQQDAEEILAKAEEADEITGKDFKKIALFVHEDPENRKSFIERAIKIKIKISSDMYLKKDKKEERLRIYRDNNTITSLKYKIGTTGEISIFQFINTDTDFRHQGYGLNVSYYFLLYLYALGIKSIWTRILLPEGGKFLEYLILNGILKKEQVKIRDQLEEEGMIIEFGTPDFTKWEKVLEEKIKSFVISSKDFDAIVKSPQEHTDQIERLKYFKQLNILIDPVQNIFIRIKNKPKSD